MLSVPPATSSKGSSSSSKSVKTEESKGEMPAKKVQRVYEKSLCTYMDTLSTSSKLIIHGGAVVSGCGGATGGAGIGAFAGPIGMGIGAGIGFIGGVICNYWAASEFQPPFQTIYEYRANNNTVEKRAAHKELVALFPSGSPLTDPISSEPLLQAVKTPQGQVFNHETILEALKSTGGTCPVTRLPLTPSDLRIDYVTMGKVKREMAKKALEGGISGAARQQAEEYSKALEKDAQEFFKKADDQFRNLLNQGKITRDQYMKELNALNEYLK